MKKLVMIFAVMASLAMMPSDADAQAQTRTFTWELPTQRTDGTPLSPAELASIRLYCNGAFVVAVAGSDMTLAQNFNPGTYECYVTATDSQARESDPSNLVTFTIEVARPEPPGNLNVS